MRCPNCQTLNPTYAKFCMECGYRLLVCSNCHTLNPPNAKFCMECGNTLQDTAPLVTSGGAAALFDNAASTFDVRSLPAPEVTESRRTPFPAFGSSSLIHLTEPEERRIVTVMFADITGSTPLAARLDPEDMRSILTGYFNLMTEQIRRHDGTVEKYIGDAVMAVFGAPVAHEDDPDRAIRAALDMQAALKTFNTRRRLRNNAETAGLQMRIGINTGEVAAPSSRFSRRDFLITGDAVNIAARLQQIAVPDTILVGERTYLATRDVFDFHSLAPVQLKGKSDPLNAWSVAGFRSSDFSVSQRPRGIAGFQTPLVGRSLELTLMHATYARVRDASHSHLITLLGAPGVGKSRLAQEFIERELESVRCTTCDDPPSESLEPRVLQGHCPSYGEGLTYWPFVEILRSLIQVQEGENGRELEKRFVDFVRQTLRQAKRFEDADKVAGVLLQSMGHGLLGEGPHGELREMQRSTYNKDTDKGGPQAVLQRAFRILLEALAQVRPLILIIDDLQWADEALLDLLEYLNGHIMYLPVLFICIARQDFLESQQDWGGGQSNFTTIILDALTREETGELIVEALATDELPDVLVHTIQQRAEGNPFFVEEIIQMLIDQGMLIRENGCWRSSVQSETVLSELSSPSIPPEDTLMDQHYVLPLMRMPDTIQGVLAARVDLLGPVEKLVLQCASIVGRTFWVSSVLELVEDLDREEVLKTLERLVQRDFIGESEKLRPGPIEQERSFSFKHILIRDVVYNNIPRARRSHKHAQLAAWLEEQVKERQETFSELLAYHYQQALLNWSNVRVSDDLRSDEAEQGTEDDDLPFYVTRSRLASRAIYYLRLAGDKAYHSYYTIRAIQAYTEALELMQEHETDKLSIAVMHRKLGHAYIQRANADEALKEYLSALRLLKALPAAPQKDLLCLYMNLGELTTRWLGWFNIRLDMREVRVYIDEGLKLLEGQPPSGEQSSFFTYLAMWYMRQVKHAPQDERAQLAEHALHNSLESLRIAEEVNDTDALWLALDALGFIYNRQCKYNEGHDTQHRRQTLLNLIEGREELYDLYNSLGWTHTYISDYSTAASWFGRSWRIAQTMESPSMLLSNLLGRLGVWYEWDRWDEVVEVARSILQTCEQYQQEPIWQLDALEMLAELMYRMGEQEESEKYLRQYRRIFEQTCDEPMLLPRIHAMHGDWEQAQADLREKVQEAEPFPDPTDLAQLAELTMLIGTSVEEQRSMCERTMGLASQSGARKALAIAQRACGRRNLVQPADWREAEQSFRAALVGFQELDLPWERAETLYCLGQYYVCRFKHQRDIARDEQAVNDDRGLARLCFEQALGFFEALHAVHDVRKVREALSS